MKETSIIANWKNESKQYAVYKKKDKREKVSRKCYLTREIMKAKNHDNALRTKIGGIVPSFIKCPKCKVHETLLLYLQINSRDRKFLMNKGSVRYPHYDPKNKMLTAISEYVFIFQCKKHPEEFSCISQR